MTGTRRMREHLALSRDAVADAAYLALTDIGPGEVARSAPIHDPDGELVGAVDLDAQGRVLGIEFLDVARRLPLPPESDDG